MTSRDKLEADALRGKRANELINDELLSWCFETLSNDFITAWQSSNIPEDRERLWTKQAVLGEVKQKLFALIANGDFAAKRIQQNI